MGEPNLFEAQGDERLVSIWYAWFEDEDVGKIFREYHSDNLGESRSIEIASSQHKEILHSLADDIARTLGLTHANFMEE